MELWSLSTISECLHIEPLYQVGFLVGSTGPLLPVIQEYYHVRHCQLECITYMELKLPPVRLDLPWFL